MRVPALVLSCAIVAAPLGAQHTGMDHAAHTRAKSDSGKIVPTMPGQAAHGAIAEIVRILDADSTTDWSKVDLERLRQHFIDMDEVVMRAQIVSRGIPGGIEAEVTGGGRERTAQAIARMLTNHGAELDALPGLVANVQRIAGGVKVRVTAESPADTRVVARIRGLGVAGLLAIGEHHAPHHLAIARGDNVHGH